MKYNLALAFAAFLCLSSFSIAVPGDGDPNECAGKLKAVGASESFDAMVAHGVHSMTLDDLRKFDPSATEKNFVPTIDLNDHFEQTLLPYLPDKGGARGGESFLTDGMTVLDLVLTHMDDRVWTTANITTIERLVHEYHMRESWARAKIEFDKIGKLIPAPNEDACKCATDIENNGVMKILTIMTMGVEQAARIYGDPAFRNLTINAEKKGFPRHYGYSTYYVSFRVYAMQKAATSPTEAKLLEGIAEALPPSVRNAEGWKAWKGKVGLPVEHHRDLALFLYCAIEKALKG